MSGRRERRRERVAGWSDVVIPRRCMVCGDPAPGLCELCSLGIEPAPMLEIDGYGSASAVMAYSGVGRELVGALKFRHRLDGVAALGAALCLHVPETPGVVTWVPTAASRRRRRGFDQAEMLARSVARRLGVAARPTVVRVSDVTTHHLGRAERFAAERFAAGRRAGVVRGRSVLVVDDVVTTGASLREVGLLLRGCGATELHAVAVAATPGGPDGGVTHNLVGRTGRGGRRG